MCPHKHHLPKLFHSEVVYLAVKLVFATYFRSELRYEPLEDGNIRLKIFCLSNTQHIFLRLCVEFMCILFSNTLSITTIFGFKLCLHCRQRRTSPAPSCIRRRRKHRAKHLTFMAFVDANCFLTASVDSSGNSYYTESNCLLMLQKYILFYVVLTSLSYVHRSKVNSIQQEYSKIEHHHYLFTTQQLLYVL